MSGETQWNKKIDFTPKKETIAEPPIIQEGFEEVDEMVRKLTDMRNQKKGFTKLPFLESIYDSITGSTPEPAPEPKDVDSDEGEYEDTDEDEDGKTIEGLKNKKKSKFQTTMEYTYNLPYNLSFDIFAYTVVQISTGKQPKFPGKKPIKPEKGAPPDEEDKYTEAKATYDKLKPAYEDKKMVALMFNRVLTCLIGIFIAYNLYFSYAMMPPPTPGVKSTFETIIDFIEGSDPVLTPLKIAATPVLWFLKALKASTSVMSAIPYQPLLFGVCLVLSYFFTTYTMGYLSSTDKQEESTILILIVFASVVATALKVCVDFQNPMPVTQVPALLLWLLVFGLSLSFLPIGKILISMILLYVGMFSMTKSEKNGMNVFQTMDDINEKLTGSKIIYDCGDDGNFTYLLKMIDKLISTIIVENLYLITLIPILLYNISKSTAISNLYIRGFSNFLFTVLILIISSNNEWAVWFYTKLMRGIYNVKDAYVYAKKKYDTNQE